MSDPDSSPAWLPVGWTTESKVRSNGKRYKCYIDPSNELKFYSKPAVLCYLNNGQINCPQSEEKDKANTKQFAVLVEKAVAEGLPPGWIKEMRVRKQGHKIKKDPYYTDPVSGYVFRSLKDVDRYLKTGELGRFASKPKDKGRVNVELGDAKLSPHAVAEGLKLADSGTYRQIIEKQSSKLVEIVKDERIHESTSTADSICLSAHASDKCREDAVASGATFPEAKGLEQREGKSESTVHTFVSGPVTGASPENLPLENGLERHGNIQLGINKSNSKRKHDLPHRASKRLAGIEVDPLPELKTSNRTRRLAIRRSDAAKSSDLATPVESAGKVETETTVHDIVLPLASVPIPEEHAGLVETDNEPDVKPGSPMNFPMADLWTDPCIEFAVKTLTGAIPVGDDLGCQDSFQQHVSSSETRG